LIDQGALDIIRSRLQPLCINYTLLSQEGWVMMLLNAIQWNQFTFARSEGDNYRARWNQLEAHACNPWTERRIMELAVSPPPPPPFVEREEKEDFDVGRVTVSRRYASGMPAYSYRPAFA